MTLPTWGGLASAATTAAVADDLISPAVAFGLLVTILAAVLGYIVRRIEVIAARAHRAEAAASAASVKVEALEVRVRRIEHHEDTED